MKKGVTANSKIFGTAPTAVNAEKCHLVGTTMLPQITQLKLYTTPVTCVDMHPEMGYYLFSHKRRIADSHRLFNWDFGRIFCNESPQRKARIHEYLGVVGVRYFVACSDCNTAHTGNYQLQNMIQLIYGEPDLQYADVYCMYTMMFDNMADMTSAVPTIRVDDVRIQNWQMELWLNYCMIMFLAQHHKAELSAKRNTMGKHMYRFTYAHRDMGMCDFYMNQMLSLILYFNFDIDVDFIWLHQNFLVHIPKWAIANHLFVQNPAHTTGTRHDYNCMWRLVLGATSDDSEFCVRTDIHDEYWYEERNFMTKSRNIIERITQFTATWLLPIGEVISSLPVAGHRGEIFSLFQNARQFADVSSFLRFADVGGGKDFYVSVVENPTLATFDQVFKEFFRNQPNYLFENFVRLSFSRTYMAYANTPTNDANYPLIRKKFKLLLDYILELVPAGP